MPLFLTLLYTLPQKKHTQAAISFPYLRLRQSISQPVDINRVKTAHCLCIAEAWEKKSTQ